MRDMKKEGDDPQWVELSVVKVPGDPEALPWDLEQHSEEKIRGSWRKVAVLEVIKQGEYATRHDTEFTVAFRNHEGRIIRRIIPAEEVENGRFGMRVGHEDVEFFVIPTDPSHRIRLYHEDTVDIDDPAWKHLPLY